MAREAVRRRAWTSLAMLATLALVVVGANRCDDPRVVSLNEGDVSQSVAVAAPTSAEIRAALLAVEYWSDPDHPDFDAIPEDLRPITLEQAVEILKRDAGSERPFGESRRRRSVITLTVEGLELNNEGVPHHRHRAALEALDAPLDEIDREIAKLVKSRTDLEPTAHAELILWVREQLPVALVKIPSLFPLSVNSCTLIGTPITDAYMEWRDWSGGLKKSPCSAMADADVVGNTIVNVDRQFCALTQLMDAQTWDAPEKPAGQCNVYFEKAELVERKLFSDEWQPVPSPPVPGSEWGSPTRPMTLHEIFLITWQPWSKSLDTRMETILNVWTDLEPNQNATTYRLDYDLNEHRSSRIGNDTRGRIDVDKGYTRVIPSGSNAPGRHSVQSEKRVRFAGWNGRSTPNATSNAGMSDWNAYYNMLACYSLQSLGKALQEFVCCDVPPPDQCSALP